MQQCQSNHIQTELTGELEFKAKGNQGNLNLLGIYKIMGKELDFDQTDIWVTGNWLKKWWHMHKIY